MKKIFRLLPAVITMAIATMIFTSCGSDTLKDEDIKVAVETALKADPMAVNTTVDVKDGVAILGGECMDDACKEHCGKLVAGIKGVKSVVNNCAVPVKTEQATPLSDEDLNKKLYDLSKDLSTINTIKIGAMNGVVQIAGPVTKKEWVALKAEIDKLKPTGYDTTMLNLQ